MVVIILLFSFNSPETLKKLHHASNATMAHSTARWCKLEAQVHGDGLRATSRSSSKLCGFKNCRIKIELVQHNHASSIANGKLL